MEEALLGRCELTAVTDRSKDVQTLFSKNGGMDETDWFIHSEVLPILHSKSGGRIALNPR